MSEIVAGNERLLVVVGPSGAGKDSVIGAWLAALPPDERPHRARRTITRETDVHEDHEPMDDRAFDAARRAGAFVFEWAAHGLHYGVRRGELQPLASGRWVVLNGSRHHLPQLRDAAPQARVIEIDAPASLRAERLAGRGRESGGDRRQRLSRSVAALRCDLHIVNDRRLDDAVAELAAWWQGMKACAASTSRRPSRPLPSPCHTTHQDWHA